MRNWFQDFMYGRYGYDQLARGMSFAVIALIIIDLFVRVNFLWVAALVLLVLTYYRVLSKNIAQRSRENEIFMNFISRFRGDGGYGGAYSGAGSPPPRRRTAEQRRAQREERRFYRFFNCPHCNQRVRVPKGKGKIEVTCPKCRTAFIRKT